MLCNDIGICIKVDGNLIRASRLTEAAADVDFADGVSRGARALDGLDGGRQRSREPLESASEPARARMEVDRVDREIVASSRGERVVEPIEVDAELRRFGTAVL